MILRLFNEFVKNLKIMFRNWTSLSLLIIAPLIFILLVGYAFSSEDVTGIKIGVVAGEGMDIDAFQESVESYAEIIEYKNMKVCSEKMKLQETHICLGFRGVLFGSSGNGAIPSGSIVYHYDNTRKAISLKLIDDLQDFFGMKAEEISIETAEAIITDIQNLINFINDRKEDITHIKNESEQIKADLTERKEKLEEVRESFLPSYERIKELQKILHNYSFSVNESAQELAIAVDETVAEISELKRNITSELKGIADDIASNLSSNLSSNLTSEIQTNTTALFALLDNIEGLMMGISNLTLATADEINSAVAALDSIVEIADEIKFTLDEEISNTEEYIQKIDDSIARIDEVSGQMDKKLEQLSELHPELAEKIVRPIASEYSKLLPGVMNIQISFPQLLVIIIMFIALLFSNISTLTEINNKAYLRNLIAPVDDIIYLVGLFLTSVLIVFVQILVLFLVAETRLGIEVYSVFWPLALVSVMLISVFILAGMAFAYMFKTVQTSILLTTFSALLFFLFGNMLAPMEAMPDMARWLTRFNPLVIGEFLVREIQLFDIPLELLTPKIALLVIYIGVLLLAVIGLFKACNRRRV